MLAEYSALRAEVERRSSIQWNVFALQVGSAGTIASLAISTSSNLALLLVVPLSSYMLGSRYLLYDYHIKLIHKYIEVSLSRRLGNNLQWEHWKGKASSRITDKDQWLTPTGWNLLHPTRLAFWGVAAGSLVAAAAAALNNWLTTPPSSYLVVAFVVGWVVDALAVVALHKSFVRSSGRDPIGYEVT